MPSLLLSNPLGADDAQEIGLEPREFAVGEVISVSDYVFATLIRTGYGIPYGVASDILLIGNGSPTEAIGVDGQWYLDKLNEVLWGPKTGGYWPADPIRPDRGVQNLRLDNDRLIVTYSTGTEADLGRVRFVTRGAWATGVTYAVDDLVTANSSTFRVKVAHTTQATDTAPTTSAPGANYEVFSAVPLATTTSPGSVQLAGDLGGTATAPTVPRLAGIDATLADKANTSDVIPLTQKGAASGVATLDPGGLIPSAQLPPLAITNTFPVASEAEQLALTAQVGDVAIRSDGAGTFILRAEPATLLANWSALATPVTVASVDGRTGVVDLSDRYLAVGTRGAVDGVASLDATGKVPLTQLPASAGGGDDAGGLYVPDVIDPAVPLEVSIVSNWGITDAGDAYYDDLGAPEAEAGLLIPDPETGSVAVWRPGAPWNNYLDRRVTTLIEDPASATRAMLSRDWGSGATLPTTGLVRGDTYFHTGLNCLMVWSDVGWRQVHVATVASAGARTALSTANAVDLYAGFRVRETDTGITWEWSGTAWGAVGGAAFPIAYLKQIAQQASLPSGFFDLTFTAEDIDSHNGHDNVTNPARWTCPAGQGGTYAVQGTVNIAGTAGWTVGIAMNKNGVKINGGQTHMPLGGTGTVSVNMPSPRVFVTLAPGDYITAQGYASTAGGYTSVGTAGNEGVGSGMTVERTR